MPQIIEIIPTIEKLVGEQVKQNIAEVKNLRVLENGYELGLSQFNEILLLCGFNTVSDVFFHFLAEGTMDFKQFSKEFIDYLVTGRLNPERVTSIKNLNQLKGGVNGFLKIALLWYGNIKFAYKDLRNDSEALREKILDSSPDSVNQFMTRHHQFKEIEEVPAEKTYLLGNLIRDNIIKEYKHNPKDIELKKKIDESDKYIEIGKKNNISYLTSDHMDVYVATSMRLEHEFIFVSNLLNDIFKKSSLKDLKLRWFDPTQAFCKNRIDKGLTEGLMLKRAKCTLYLAQESDTFGKDSELASTLAQGKPVIAYVPFGNKTYVNDLLDNLKTLNPQHGIRKIILDQLKVFNPLLPWEDKTKKIRSWLSDPDKVPIKEMKEKLYQVVKEKYDKRADNLKKKHPLGIQVNLNSGVANGVLVVRKKTDCVNLIRSIILNDMDFSIETKYRKNQCLYLREKISDSIFRLKTQDTLLTNSFWNYYTDPKYN